MMGENIALRTECNMPLKLMYITNNPMVAKIAENSGVDRIWIDLETKGKEQRQKNMDTVKSRHAISDIKIISDVLEMSELMVRINPFDKNTHNEIENVISAGAQRIMLPMWKTPDEVNRFLEIINKRVHTTLLLETKEAVECLDAVLENPLVDEIHIGLNDLHLSYGLNFLFELLTNGTVETICNKCKSKNIPYGFGGIARLGEGIVPAERIITEHYRLGSTRAILSRSFCNTEVTTNLKEIEKLFSNNMKKLRAFEKLIENTCDSCFEENKKMIDILIAQCVEKIKEKKNA